MLFFAEKKIIAFLYLIYFEIYTKKKKNDREKNLSRVHRNYILNY